MKYLAAYSLLVLAGKKTPTAEDVEKVLKAVGVHSKREEIEAMIICVNGRKLHELVFLGSRKLASAVDPNSLLSDQNIAY